MSVILPLVPSVPSYRVSTTLDSVTYVLDLHWNTRAISWYMDLMTSQAEPIRMGMRVVLGAALGRRSRDIRFPPGIFTVIDTTDEGREAGLDDLGVRVVVIYTPFTEMIAQGLL